MGVGCGVFQKVDVGCGVFQKVVVGCGVFLKWGWTWTGVERLPSDASHWLPLAPLTPCCENILCFIFNFFFFHFICLGHWLPLLPLTHSMQQRHRFNPRGRAKSSQVHLLCKECIVHGGPTYDSYAQTKTKIVSAI